MMVSEMHWHGAWPCDAHHEPERRVPQSVRRTRTPRPTVEAPPHEGDNVFGEQMFVGPDDTA